MQGSLLFPLSLHLAQNEWLWKPAIKWPHPPRFCTGEAIMIYALNNIRWNTINSKTRSNLTNIHKKMELVKIRLQSTRPKRKRCYDVTLSRQEGSTMRHRANAQYWTGLAGGNTGCLFLTFGRPVCADQISNCPSDRMY